MEFWGVEVKSGESLMFDPGDDKIIHLSNACLGDVTKDKGGEPVVLYVSFDNQKLVLGTLSSDKFPQISYDLIFEKEFELSHNWKNGSVFFTGFKAQAESDNDDEDSDGKPEFKLNNGVNTGATEAKSKKIVDSGKSEKDTNGGYKTTLRPVTAEIREKVNAFIHHMSSSKTSDIYSSECGGDEEEALNKIEASNKRIIDSSKKTSVPQKKAKLVAAQKADCKRIVHVATPHPSKQAGKATSSSKQQTPKSGGHYRCKPCSRSFKTEDALCSHNRAKHSSK